MDFTNKNILVIGASSGIGYALAKELVEQNANVLSASRSMPEGLDVKHIQLDVTNFTGTLDLPDELHGLAYCPGSINLKPFNRLKPEDFTDDFALNVVGAVQLIQAALPSLKKAKGAGIVLYSTVAVQTGMSFHASVAAAKGAIEGLGRSLAAELAPQNIRVNVIAPSLTDTPLASKLLSSEDKRDASDKRHPLGRVGTPEDLASLSAFLLSDQSSWITGQVLGVDGGMSGTRSI